MYKHASEVLRKTILPYVVGVHGLDIPYPAQLIGESAPLSESGSVVFRLDERGLLLAEYFSYDSEIGDVWSVPATQSDGPKFVRLVDTGVDIPVRFVKSSRKTSTIYTNVEMPLVMATECGISGWIGDASVKMNSAVATLDGCAVLPLLTSGERSFLDAREEKNILPGPSYYDSRTSEVIQLSAGSWEVSIHSFSGDRRESLSEEPPYSISIRRAEGCTFRLSGQSEILQLLILLLSFSSERWVQYSTIYGRMPEVRPDVVNRAFVGRFASQGWSEKREIHIPELSEWPVVFKGLWDSRESPQMLSALTHLISCSDRSKDGVFSFQDLVDAGGALEAAVRLWNDLPPNHRFFGGKKADSLKSQLHRVVEEFRMAGRMLNRNEVFKVVLQAHEYRNTLAHGSGGEFNRSGNDEAEKLFAHQQYLYYLARLLVLAKLGGSSGHPGFPYYAPKLIDA